MGVLSVYLQEHLGGLDDGCGSLLVIRCVYVSNVCVAREKYWCVSEGEVWEMFCVIYSL